MDGKKQSRKVRYKKALDSRYEPTKAEMEADISVNVSPKRLAKAVLSGSAKRREGKKTA